MGRLEWTMLGLFSSAIGLFLILTEEDVFIGICFIMSAALYPLFVDDSKEEEEGECL